MKMVGASRRSNVATSPRRDATTSRRWVNHYKSQQAVTSRRLNVVTSQRRNVATSRCQLEIGPPSLKAKGVQNLRGDQRSGNVRTRARKSDQQRHRSRRRSRDLYCFFVLDNRTDVLYVTY